ncbi:hypothetical protein [Magnetospirillum sulfuroxidans]|uniref:Uncharacterized protein n=1 Tax=Magnetospirillum sulfuroxidans TaxID=611300 RepID=A0ABS5IAS7_9PROT|nr:hypothetical protein [Magnetospirillum sulfuroxidans]MBR9970818.1 hypothetical protein [Magnetospirillum sulfuroxidans]
MGGFANQLMPTSLADTMPDIPKDALKNPGIMLRSKQLKATATSRYGDDGLVKSKLKGD